ncbi:MAG: kelch repeat-containing protein [Actinomycetota bacterium]
MAVGLLLAIVIVANAAGGPAHAEAGSASRWVLADGHADPGQRLGETLTYDTAADQMILFGGQRPNVVVNDTWAWSGSRWTRLNPATSPPARVWAAAAYDPASSKMVLFGGSDGSGGALGDTWSWDGSTWTQMHPSTAPSARWGASMFYDPATKRVVLFGGTPGLTGPDDGDTWTWDGSSWSPQLAAVSPPPRSFAASASGSGSTPPVLFGGESTHELPLADTWTWDGVAKLWNPHLMTDGPAGRTRATMAYDPALSGAVLFGGNVTLQGGTAETWLWNGATWEALSSPSSPSARGESAIAFDPRVGLLVLYGGSGAGALDTWISDTWSFDGRTWNEQDVGAPSARLWSMGARASEGEVVLFGGQGAYGQNLRDTWTWDGSWHRVSSGGNGQPPARYGGAMAYDTALGETVLFGGRGDAGYLGDMWTWTQEGGWSPAPEGDAPVPAVFVSMAYDPSTHQVVAFGGCCHADGNGWGDTWIWDGATWTEQEPADGPSGRFGASMAYDPTLGEVVLFGGVNALPNSAAADTPSLLNDTWAWDGSSWTELHPAHTPPGREMASMAYDPSMTNLVLFGGCVDVDYPTICPGRTIAGQAALGDTWTWDGADWTESDDQVAPAARDGALAVEGDATHRMLVFGGQGNEGTGSYGGNFLRDTWTRSP